MYRFRDSYVLFDILERLRIQRKNGLGLNGMILRGVRMMGKGTLNVSFLILEAFFGSSF